MRNGTLAALTVLLAGHGLAFTQQFGPSPPGHSWGPTGPPPQPPDADPSPTIFNPDPACELFFALEATAFEQARTVRLLSGETELARFRFVPGPRKLVIT